MKLQSRFDLAWAYLVMLYLLSNLDQVTPSASRTFRQPLTRDRVLHAAVGLADREGLGALTMRRLGAELGVEAMSLYKHVASKGQILDGIVELIVSQIEVPTGAADWTQAMRQRATSARQVLARHSWAIGLLESRTAMAPVTMGYLDAMLGTLRSQGFSIEDAAHALWLLDSYVYGHVVQETSLSAVRPAEPGNHIGSVNGATTEYPHLAELEQHAARSAFSLDHEFAHGLDLILDALERTVTSPPDR